MPTDPSSHPGPMPPDAERELRSDRRQDRGEEEDVVEIQLGEDPGTIAPADLDEP